MTEPQQSERRLRFYRATGYGHESSGNVRAFESAPSFAAEWQPIPELDRLLEILPQLERLVDLYRECRLPATLAPDKPLWLAAKSANQMTPSQFKKEYMNEWPQPDKPLSVDEARAKIVCRKCGIRASDCKSKYCGDGSDKDNQHIWQPEQAAAAARGIAEEIPQEQIDADLEAILQQRAASERKEPPPFTDMHDPNLLRQVLPEPSAESEPRKVRVFCVNSSILNRRIGEVIALEKIGEEWTFGPNSGWRFSDESIRHFVAIGDWTERTADAICKPEASAESELADTHEACDALANANIEQANTIAALKQQLAAAKAEAKGWHGVVMDCERIVKAVGTAESPLMSNLANLVRDKVVEIERLKTEAEESNSSTMKCCVVEKESLRAERDKAQADLRAWREAAEGLADEIEWSDAENDVSILSYLYNGVKKGDRVLAIRHERMTKKLGVAYALRSGSPRST